MTTPPRGEEATNPGARLPRLERGRKPVRTDGETDMGARRGL